MRPIVVHCGRPDWGGKARRGTSLAAPSAAASAISSSRHAGRASAICGADVFSRDQGGGGRQATTGHRSPNLFLGLGRALQPSEQTARCIADLLQTQNLLLVSCIRNSPQERANVRTKAVQIRTETGRVDAYEYR